MKYFVILLLLLILNTAKSQHCEVLGDSIVLIANPHKVTVQNALTKKILFTLRQDSAKPEFTQCLFIPKSTNILITTYKGDSYIWDWSENKLKNYLHLRAGNFDHGNEYDGVNYVDIDPAGNYLSHRNNPNNDYEYFDLKCNKQRDTLKPTTKNPEKTIEYFNKLDKIYNKISDNFKDGSEQLVATASSYWSYYSRYYYDTLYKVNRQGTKILRKNSINTTSTQIHFNRETNKIYVVTDSFDIEIYDGNTLKFIKKLTNVKKRFPKYFNAKFFKHFYILNDYEKKWSICNYSNDKLKDISVKNNFLYISKDENYLIQFLNEKINNENLNRITWGNKISLTNLSNLNKPLKASLSRFSILTKYFDHNSYVLTEILRESNFGSSLNLRDFFIRVSVSGKVLFVFKYKNYNEIEFIEAYKIEKDKFIKIEN